MTSTPVRTSRVWYYRVAACIWLLATVAVQVLVGWLLLHLAQPVTAPALIVASTGLGLGLLGYGLFRMFSKRGVAELGSVAVLLALAGVVLACGGFLWASPGDEVSPFYVELMFLVICVIGVFSYNGRTDEKPARPWRWLALPLAILALTGCLSLVPNGLGLQFRVHDESKLNRLLPLTLAAASSASQCISGAHFPEVPSLGRVSWVCASAGYVEFDAVNDYGYIYYRGPLPADGQCVLHLDGPWWEVAPGGDGAGCPTGFTPLPGGP